MRYLSLAPLLAGALAVASAQTPDAASRGEKLFFEGVNGVACGNCHSLGEKGKAIAPDLKPISRVSPKGLVLAINASRTQYVRDIELKSGKHIQVLPISGSDYWVLSTSPILKQTITKPEIERIQDNAKWKHPPESTNLTKDQLADLISYIRFAGHGDTKGVTAAEIP